MRQYLDAREPAFLMAVAPGKDAVGVALLDLSTGEFSAAEYAGADGMQALADELAVLKPREILVASGENGAAGARRGVQCKNTHALDLSICQGRR